MSNRSPVPNLPPVSGIQDPATRAYLEALTQAWLVRNGQTRNTDEKFLTVKDLEDGITQAVRGGGVNILGGGSGNPTAQIIASVIQSLTDSIQQSRLWKLLGERIEKIEMPEWFQGRFGAEIKTEQIKIENATNALAKETTTAITNINGNIAIAQKEIKAVSDKAGATASQVTTLQTTVNNTTVTAQNALSIAQSVDGQVDGAWSVKFDANGYVTGAGLGIEGKGGNYSSEFTVRADRFSIGAPANPSAMADPDVPFIVTTGTTTIGGITYPPGTWIKTAYIADATIGTAKIANAAITSAKIKDAEVGTLKIANNAVTVPQYFSGSAASMDLAGGGGIVIYACETVNYDRSCTFDMYINGVLQHSQSAGARTNSGADTTSQIPVVLIHGITGANNVVTVQVVASVVANIVSNERIVILGAKR